MVCHDNFEQFFSRLFSDFGLLDEMECETSIQWPSSCRCTIPDLMEAFKQVGKVDSGLCSIGNWCFEQFSEKVGHQ